MCGIYGLSGLDLLGLLSCLRNFLFERFDLFLQQLGLALKLLDLLRIGALRQRRLKREERNRCG